MESYSQVKDAKLTSLPAVTIQWRHTMFNYTFLLNGDLLAVGEAGEKHQEAVDGAAWLSVLKESWQDQEAASN